MHSVCFFLIKIVRVVGWTLHQCFRCRFTAGCLSSGDPTSGPPTLREGVPSGLGDAFEELRSSRLLCCGDGLRDGEICAVGDVGALTGEDAPEAGLATLLLDASPLSIPSTPRLLRLFFFRFFRFFFVASASGSCDSVVSTVGSATVGGDAAGFDDGLLVFGDALAAAAALTTSASSLRVNTGQAVMLTVSYLNSVGTGV